MLTLTRKVGEKIRIGDEIEIVVREIRGRQVRLGISAPGDLPVYREELYLQIIEERGEPAAVDRQVRREGPPASPDSGGQKP